MQAVRVREVFPALQQSAGQSNGAYERGVLSVPLSDNARPCAGMAVGQEKRILLHNGEKDSIMFLAVRLRRCVGGVCTWAGPQELPLLGATAFTFCKNILPTFCENSKRNLCPF